MRERRRMNTDEWKRSAINSILLVLFKMYRSTKEKIALEAGKGYSMCLVLGERGTKRDERLNGRKKNFFFQALYRKLLVRQC